ncbi:MAG: hypothetical protein L3V56_14585, partial [Candidatus Magnetoovum sp. WYHC-5]|nr:hypothetical protein [Candidatus Magnetoovum sp. WYHC-5]
ISCSYSPDGKKVLSGSSDNTLKLWDVETGKEEKEFVGHKDAVRSCSYSPDGKKVLSGSDDKTLKLWDVETGNILADIKLLWIVFDIKFISNDIVITANGNGTLTKFDISDCHVLV